MKSVATVVLCLLLATCMAYAQGVGASGDLKGTVTDPSGALVTGATVTVTQPDRGTKRTTTTDANGDYRVPLLPPANYDVSVEHAGFQTMVQKGITINVGQVVNLDFHLKVSGTQTTVEVTTEAPVVETDRGSLADTVTQKNIDDLPINRRDYLTFTLLSPGVSESTQLAGDQDFRVKQTPQSGLSFYGSNGRGNDVRVDGGEANDDSGGVRLTLGQDAVQEFQINRSNYAADLGGASGASLNIVSKSGTNDVHGDVFGFFRSNVFDARNPFAVTPALLPGQLFNPALPDVHGLATKDTLSREQFGATVGFPITKDKTFLFASFEGLIQNAQDEVPLLTNTSIFRPLGGQQTILNGLATLPGNPSVPCLTGQPALPAATCAAILRNILTVNPAAGPLSAYLVNQFETNGGQFAYDTDDYLASVRLDHQFSDRNQVYLRYSFGHDTEQNPDLQSLIGFSAGSAVHAIDHTLEGKWLHQFSPFTLNEIVAQFNYSNFDVIPNAPGQVGLVMPGFANLGTNIFLPSKTIMRRWEFADNATLLRGHHTIKFGGEFLYRGNHTESNTFFPGRFVFGNLPGGVLSPCLQVPAACGLAANTVPQPISPLQSASLGLPIFYQQGFGNGVYNYPRPFTAFYAQDSWAVRPNFTFTFGLRYELDAQYGALSTDKDNFAPRIAFAWDPFKDHKTVVRGGFGLFYSPIYGQIADVVQTLGLVNGFQQIAQVFVPLTGAPGNPALTSAAIFQTLFAQGKVQCAIPAPGNAACITPADLTQFGININHTGTAPLSVFFSGQPDYQSPYSEQAEFGIEREISAGWSIGGSYIYSHTLHLPVALDLNNLPTAPFTTAVSPFTGQQVTFQNWAAPQCGLLLNNPCFASLLILQNNQYSSAGSALYHGGIFEVKKRFSNHWSLLANYTYSKAISDVTDFNSDFAPFNQTLLRAERSLADFDQRHKLVVAAILESPWTENGFTKDWQLSPIIRYNSGHPYNILANGSDVNGDRHSTNDRPLGYGRNSGIGPDFFTFDMRLSRSLKLGERVNLMLAAEAFNLFNRTNFGAVNNECPVLNGFANPAVCGVHQNGFFLDPITNPVGGTPAAFTAGAGTFARRQMQFGFRLSF
ncbi:MAG TPA: carboxypeptidase regulatory-like domain-containing protein [Terriglobales bacterium]|nr:carboxypeptidase regulatory-like domain-containing protein [Terriglobales bacterium]